MEFIAGDSWDMGSSHGNMRTEGCRGAVGGHGREFGPGAGPQVRFFFEEVTSKLFSRNIILVF